MVQKAGGPGEKHIFPAIGREYEAEAGDRSAQEASKEADMKCDYCSQYDHLESSCPVRKTDRRTELIMGWFFLVFLGTFHFIGMIAGAVWSAMKAGFDFGDGAWPQAWASMRGKKKDDVESNSV
jgi:hypothetical protein